MGAYMGFATGGCAQEVMGAAACYAEKTPEMPVTLKTSPSYSTASTLTMSSSTESLESIVSAACEDYSPGFDRYDDRLGTFM